MTVSHSYGMIELYRVAIAPVGFQWTDASMVEVVCMEIWV